MSKSANALVPIWMNWKDKIPKTPMAADLFDDGVSRMPRDLALRKANVEFNSTKRVEWMIFDLDHPDSYDVLDRSNLPKPNIFAQNRSNGHGHAHYALDGFIGLTDVSHVAPIKLAADVQRGMTRRLGADPRYSNRFAKNPDSSRWAASFIAPHPYHLTDLLAALDKADVRRPLERIDLQGLGRNCGLFDIVRVWAYANVLSAKGSLNAEQWFREVFKQVALHNLDFAKPLPVAETRQIAKSIAIWTWRHFSSRKFSQIQAQRRAASAEAQRQQTRMLIDRVSDHNPEMDVS